MAMQLIREENWFTFLCDVQDVTYIRMKFHKPIISPFSSGIKVNLGLLCICLWTDDLVDYAIVSKESESRVFKVVIEIINIYKK